MNCIHETNQIAHLDVTSSNIMNCGANKDQLTFVDMGFGQLLVQSDTTLADLNPPQMIFGGNRSPLACIFQQRQLSYGRHLPYESYLKYGN